MASVAVSITHRSQPTTIARITCTQTHCTCQRMFLRSGKKTTIFEIWCVMQIKNKYIRDIIYRPILSVIYFTYCWRCDAPAVYRIKMHIILSYQGFYMCSSTHKVQFYLWACSCNINLYMVKIKFTLCQQKHDFQLAPMPH